MSTQSLRLVNFCFDSFTLQFCRGSPFRNYSSVACFLKAFLSKWFCDDFFNLSPHTATPLPMFPLDFSWLYKPSSMLYTGSPFPHQTVAFISNFPQKLERKKKTKIWSQLWLRSRKYIKMSGVWIQLTAWLAGFSSDQGSQSCIDNRNTFLKLITEITRKSN